MGVGDAASGAPAEPPPPRGGSMTAVVEARGSPELRDALASFPGFSELLAVQDDVLAELQAALFVAPARTKHTDGEGVLTLRSLQPGVATNLFRSYRTPPPPSPTPPLRTMTQIAARYKLPDGTVRCYTKTTASPPDEWPTPQLDIEVGGTEQSLIFYASLGPRAPLTSDLPYLSRYYDQPPPLVTAPPPPPQQQRQQQGAPQGGGATVSASAATATSPLPSFKQLEADARRAPGFAPFVSPSLWVRALAAGALCFQVAWDGGRNTSAMQQLRTSVRDITRVWLAHLMHDAQAAAAAATGAQQSPGASAEAAVAEAPWCIEQRRHMAHVLRNHVRYDPLTPMLYGVYGEEAVTAWIETVAGDSVAAAP